MLFGIAVVEIELNINNNTILSTLMHYFLTIGNVELSMSSWTFVCFEDIVAHTANLN